jgi:hypothetical protein
LLLGQIRLKLHALEFLLEVFVVFVVLRPLRL